MTRQDPLALLARKKGRTRRVAVLVDPDLGTAENAARAALLDGRMALARGEISDDDVAALEADLAAAEQAVVDGTVVFRFASIGSSAWRDLLDDYPATPEQVKDAATRGQWLAFDPVAFPPAAIAAVGKIEIYDDAGEVVEEIELDPDVVVGWYKDPEWSPGDLGQLFDAAQTVNLATQVTDWGKGSGSTRT